MGQDRPDDIRAGRTRRNQQSHRLLHSGTDNAAELCRALCDGQQLHRALRALAGGEHREITRSAAAVRERGELLDGQPMASKLLVLHTPVLRRPWRRSHGSRA
ncbi:hypothetical protein O7626_00770 [Micromonospora sp. WMMD1102]|uniref:hypothetical protein n=1 Tax=Micromonospora sp. WMMD1102 TaxID=3016105 RepID=UPI0024155FBA|nr:hypothetical protein [Micromonospora sp. WMMD1102]MDG4784480.1 hypothetical protein [Micromonospora sp. WMMD1102]